MAKRLLRAVSFVFRLLSPRAWVRMLVRLLAGGGADRRPGRAGTHPDQARQANPVESVTEQTESEAGAIELVSQQQIPVEVAPGTQPPAPPGTSAMAGIAEATRDESLGVASAAGSVRVDTREVLLRRAIAADAPAWAPLPAEILTYYARRAMARTGPILMVDGLMTVQATLPTRWIPTLLN